MSTAGRVLVLDSHAHFRQAVVDGLRRQRVACDGLADPHEAGKVLRRGLHDVLVVDLSSAANRRLLLTWPPRPQALPVVGVTSRPSLESALAALRVRAFDYLTKPVRLPVVLESIHLALRKAQAVHGVRRAERLITRWAEWMHLLDAILTAPGPPSLPNRLLVAIARDRSPGEGGAGWHNPASLLSPREQEVLTAFASGLRVRQIARTLGVSVHTARAHMKAVMRKLNVHSQTALLVRLSAWHGDSSDVSQPDKEDPDDQR